MNSPSNYDICYYHRNCLDGIVAAYPLWCENKQTIDVNYGEEWNLDNCKDKNIVIVDFCFPLEIMIRLCDIANTILLIDHHKSSIDTIEKLKIKNRKNLHVVFDINLAACQLSFHYFYGVKSFWLTDTVADRDLWKFNSDPFPCIDNKESDIPGTQAVCRAIDERGYSWENIESYITTGDARTLYSLLYAKGVDLLRFDSKLVDEMVSKSNDYIYVDDNDNNDNNECKKPYEVRITCCNIDKYISEVGYKLYTQYNCDFAVVYSYNHNHDTWRISCRGDGIKVDLSEFCSKFYKGGGHKGAGGFTIYGPRYGGINITKKDENRIIARGGLLDIFTYLGS